MGESKGVRSRRDSRAQDKLRNVKKAGDESAICRIQTVCQLKKGQRTLVSALEGFPIKPIHIDEVKIRYVHWMARTLRRSCDGLFHTDRINSHVGSIDIDGSDVRLPSDAAGIGMRVGSDSKVNPSTIVKTATTNPAQTLAT